VIANKKEGIVAHRYQASCIVNCAAINSDACDNDDQRSKCNH